jgi:hypothetical protein
MTGRDVNAFVQEDALFVISDQTDWSGWRGDGIVRYEVAKVRDVRNLRSRAAYHVRCTVRLRVFNSSAFDLQHTTPDVWAGYPVSLVNVLQPGVAPGSPPLAITLTDYTPKTVNTSVSADIAQVKGLEQSLTRQHTVGSATTVTNSFGANLGANSEGPTGGVSFEHAETTESRDEWMTAANNGSSSQLTSSAAMTIKDWGAFARLGIDKDDTPNVTWIWAQEYPWDVVLARPQNATQANIPTDVQYRMSQNGLVEPPSHLSQMGFDFVCQATWLVTPQAWSPTAEPQLTLTHSGVFWQATHAKDSGKVTPGDDPHITITLNQTTYPNIPTGDPAKDGPIVHTLPLERYALIPVTISGAGHRAMIGFMDAEIHAQDATGFTASSRQDNLYVAGNGFAFRSGSGNNLAGMELKLDAGASGTLDIYFKALDRDVEYDLALKHWITGSRPATVAIWLNPDPKLDIPHVLQTLPTVRRYVTEHEGDGGDDNVTMVSLRSLGFGAVDYHDYMVLGMNRIVVRVSPSQDDPDPAGVDDTYVLRAIAIA